MADFSVTVIEEDPYSVIVAEERDFSVTVEENDPYTVEIEEC
jgi:hypothetical protein